MKKNIDLKEVIDRFDLEVNFVAELLWPENKFKREAVVRVMNREGSNLDSEQVARLADYLGVQIEVLYSREGWRAERSGNFELFKKGDFIAQLDTNSWKLKVFHLKKLILKEALVCKAINVSDFINKLNSIICEYEKRWN